MANIICVLAPSQPVPLPGKGLSIEHQGHVHISRKAAQNAVALGLAQWAGKKAVRLSAVPIPAWLRRAMQHPAQGGLMNPR